MKNIGKALKVLRKYYELDQSDIANSSGLHFTCVSALENGRRIPSLTVLKKYSDIFGIPISSIIFLAEALEKRGDVSAFISPQVVPLLKLMKLL